MNVAGLPLTERAVPRVPLWPLAGRLALREALVAEHAAAFGRTDDLLIGLQLTHSGRFARPNGKQLEPAILYHHPVLDRKFRIPPGYPPPPSAQPPFGTPGITASPSPTVTPTSVTAPPQPTAVYRCLSRPAEPAFWCALIRKRTECLGP
jgi:hypothetical protein